MTEPCPECGYQDLGNGLFTLPRGYPFEVECQTCKKRGYDAFYELGRKTAMEREVAVMKTILGES
jgi:hypothetical protein